ncbi:equilibrative nucleotide transporter 8 isoform X1 [Punica granatum]|uniref:Equilibrative nucleotide transporter 8 isoform X1 n=1 Tax=Punica granatum TaxID=22663 RepID=A0A6P8CB08_PUNGR|nr:equilibrative nucleotide transporter 8 isoform X1 [Punica granatum]
MEALKVPGREQEQLVPIRDTYKIAYIIHFLLGAGNLLPWNAFITAIDYFGYLYPGNHIERVFSVAYMSSSVLILVIVVGFGGWSRRLSFRTRMNFGFFMFVASLMVAPVMDWTWSGGSRTGKNQDEAYPVTVLVVVVCGLADGLIGGSLIGSAGKLPKQYMQAVFAGTASSDAVCWLTGVLVSVLRIITKASLRQNPQGLRTSAHFYFIVSTFILVACTVCCNLLYKLPVMRQHYMTLHGDPPSPRPRFLEVAEKIRFPGLGIVLIYIVTLSIFPGFLAENVRSDLLRDWYPVLLITTYNVADLMGKSLTAVYVMPSIKRATWLSTGRLMFYPSFMACLHGPQWLKSEVPVAILTFLLGLTNGYLTSVLMILAPKSVPATEAELSAIIMVVFLGVGLVSGSVIGWFWII